MDKDGGAGVRLRNDLAKRLGPALGATSSSKTKIDSARMMRNGCWSGFDDVSKSGSCVSQTMPSSARICCADCEFWRDIVARFMECAAMEVSIDGLGLVAMASMSIGTGGGIL